MHTATFQPLIQEKKIITANTELIFRYQNGISQRQDLQTSIKVDFKIKYIHTPTDKNTRTQVGSQIKV